jgi:hypothetical protein
MSFITISNYEGTEGTLPQDPEYVELVREIADHKYIITGTEKVYKIVKENGNQTATAVPITQAARVKPILEAFNAQLESQLESFETKCEMIDMDLKADWREEEIAEGQQEKVRRNLR